MGNATPQFKQPDKTKKRRKNTLWCPYCGDWIKFKHNQPMRSPDFKGFTNPYKVCTNCGISVEDFWVKKANHLWGSISIKPSNQRVPRKKKGESENGKEQ